MSKTEAIFCDEEGFWLSLVSIIYEFHLLGWDGGRDSGKRKGSMHFYKFVEDSSVCQSGGVGEVGVGWR